MKNPTLTNGINLVFLGMLSFSFGSLTGQTKPIKPNVLFIVVDDLRPELNCYGATHMKTPNIDRLARQGVLFERAYCQQAVCAPSRNTVLTGYRPDGLGIYDLGTFFRDKRPDVVTLPEQFELNGYRTEAYGKVHHDGHGNKVDPQSWSTRCIPRGEVNRSLEKITRGDTTELQSDYPKVNNLNLAWYCTDTPEENMTDAILAKMVVERIKALKDSTFFLAVGFVKPHLPFVAPRKYWDMYDPSAIKIPEQRTPEGMPDYAILNFGELRKYHNIPETGLLDEETSRNLIHGYYASVSMTDAQIGRLLDALEDNGLSQNTIVVLWGDHGYKLGDFGSWCKHSNVELDTNAPLLISAPRIKKGVKTNSLAELVDIYPTLCDLAGLKKPSHLEGTSLVPVLKDPSREVKKVALSQYPRGKRIGPNGKMEIMGYSMRTENYRYTRWQKYENPEEVVAVELYDLSYGKAPMLNLATDKNYQKEVNKLDKLLTSELGKYKLLK